MECPRTAVFANTRDCELRVHDVRTLVILVHGVGVHGEDKMEHRTAQLRQMLAKEIKDPIHAATISFEYIQWHEELHVTQVGVVSVVYAEREQAGPRICD